MRSRGARSEKLRRSLAAVLCLCMVLSLFTGMTLRSGGSDVPQPADDEIVVVPEIVDQSAADAPAADVPADQPQADEPAADVPAEPEPAETPEPVATPEPLAPVEPTAEPTEATPEPLAPVEPTAEPTEATPEPGTEPEATPEPGGSQEPEATEEPIPTPEIRDDVCKHHPVHTPECFFEQNGFCGFQCPICDPELFVGITGAVTITVPGFVAAQAAEGGAVRADLLAGVDARDLEGAGCAVSVFSVVDSQGQPVTVIDGQYIEVTAGESYVIVYVATNETGMILAAADRELSAEAAIAAAGSEFTVDGQPAQNEFIYEQNGITVKLTLTGAAVTKGAAVPASGEAMPAAVEASAPAESLAEPDMDVTFFEDGSGEYDSFEAFYKSMLTGQNGEMPDTDDPAVSAAAENAQRMLAMFVMKPELTLNGAELDLSGCTAKAEITMTQAAVATDEAAAVSAGEEEHAVDVSALQNGMSGVEEVDKTVMDLLGDVPAELAFEDIPEDGIMVVAINAAADPTFIIQNYFWYDQLLNRSVTGVTSNVSLPFIDTSSRGYGYGDNNGAGGDLPTNDRGNGQDIVNMYLTNLSGIYREFATDEVLTEMFQDQRTTYLAHPQISFMDPLYASATSVNDSYTLSQIWVYQPGAPAAGGTDFVAGGANRPSNYLVYNVPVDTSTGTANQRHAPERIRFTNNPNSSRLTIEQDDYALIQGGDRSKVQLQNNHSNSQYVVTYQNEYSAEYPYNQTILIRENTIVRLVFEDTTGSRPQATNFFDYNITDGWLYDNATNAQGGYTNNAVRASSQAYGTYYCVNTLQQGINSPRNYPSGTGSTVGTDYYKYAFGNANTGSGMNLQTYDGNRMNMYNNGVFQGCTFGLVNSGSLAYDRATGLPYIQSFSGDVIGPDIFGPDAETGKFPYTNGEYTLNFARSGGTYTLDSVTHYGGAVETNLGQFFNTWTDDEPIWSNDFWPMDDEGHVDGHDMMFGATAQRANRQFRGVGNSVNEGSLTVRRTGNLPTSDYGGQGQASDHNPNFGMSYTVLFTLEPGYTAPLDYLFYGDDDMWVFLDCPDDPNFGTKLVADIGGVHSSVGTYVNLWDWLPRIANDGTAKQYRMSVFYTERGESGSTCYMRFTLPLDTMTGTAVAPAENIVVEKTEISATTGAAVADATVNHVDRVVFDNDTGTGEDAWPTDPANMNETYLNAHKRPGFFIYRMTVNDSRNVAFQDLLSYEIYDREANILRESGVLGRTAQSPGATQQEYWFALKSGEYIVIDGLEQNMSYTVEELAHDRFIVGYQTGDRANAADTSRPAVLTPAVIPNFADSTGALNNNTTDYVLFTNSPAVKTEPDPGNTVGVQVGDEITYNIYWVNDTSAESVVIRDKLDPGVEIVAAKIGDNTDLSHSWWVLTDDQINRGAEQEEGGDTIRYSTNYIFSRDDPEIRDTQGDVIAALEARYGAPGGPTVIWTLHGTSGTVSLRVRVTEAARAADDGEGVSPTVYDQASVQVGNDSYAVTNRVENPVWDPIKTETQITGAGTINVDRNGADGTTTDDDLLINDALPKEPNDHPDKHKWEGPEVFVGDVITYRVTWKNYLTETADIVITDPLDANVAYVTDSARAYACPLDPATLLPESARLPGDNKGAGVYDETSRTITWTLDDVAAGDEGYVEFQVRVLDTATPVGEVWNNASVNVIGNTIAEEHWTDWIENPTPEVHKTEPDPGDGVQTEVGQAITYNIYWENYRDDGAVVTVADPLDPGVDFRSASYDGVELTAEAVAGGTFEATGTVEVPNLVTTTESDHDVPLTIEYHEDTHTVTWTFGTATDPAGPAGHPVPSKGYATVELQVTVNRDAFKEWKYDTGGVNDDERAAPPAVDPDNEDYEVWNRATVQVNNEPRVRTDVMENPVPEKTETAIDNPTTDVHQDVVGSFDEENGVYTAPLVYAGDQITYEIGWRNGTQDDTGAYVPANVTVTDTLDPGVDLVSASFGTVTMEANGVTREGDVTIDGATVHVTISYGTDRTVTWTLTNVPGDYQGIVTLVVEVNEDAVPVGKVDNNAVVNVNEHPSSTSTWENRVPKLLKSEPNPGPGRQVMVGQDVEYSIRWNNFEVFPTQVVITDYLDPGVTFKTATFGDTSYSEGGRLLSQSTGHVTLSTAGVDGTQTGTVTLTAYTYDAAGTATAHTQEVQVTIQYSQAQHCITWTLGATAPSAGAPEDGRTGDGVPAGFDGQVDFTVTVNENAVKDYEYTADPPYFDQFPGTPDTDHDDDLIRNRGGLKVGNRDKVATNIIENPTKPEKTETMVNASPVPTLIPVNNSTADDGSDLVRGPEVYVGDQIAYQVTWQNTAYDAARYPTETVLIPAQVIITDPLDPGVDFVSANYHDVTIDAEHPSATGEYTVGGVTFPVTIEYIGNTDPRKVVWTFGDEPLGGDATEFPPENMVPAGYTDVVGLTVEVTARASDNPQDNDGRVGVVNQASVNVQNGPFEQTQVTDRVENRLLGWLTINKVVGGLGDENRDFRFQVQVVPAKLPLPDGTYGQLDFTGGVANFTLRHNQSITARDLPAPFTYTVTELDANLENYMTTAYNDTGEVLAGQGGSASFTNYIPMPDVTPTPPPSGEPHKTETEPGDKVPVEVGEIITYRIDWVNYKAETATVTIRDPLDIGVDFYSANYQNVVLHAGEDVATGEGTGPNGPTQVRITRRINETTGHDEIVWELGEKASRASGSVYLQVLVTERAVQKDDLTVYNQAFVKINGDPEQATEIPENPVPTPTPTGGPHKVETNPGDKLPVKIGDQITYRIDWENYKGEAATVAVRDPLDPGVKFVSASYGGLTLTADNDSTEGGAMTADGRTVHITMRQAPGEGDLAGRTVVYWDLGEHPAGYKDSVILTVEVTEKALDNADLTVYNQAFVKVNGDPEQETEIPENPIPTPTGEPHKVETDPGDKVPVQVGQEITYRIDWVNYKPVAATVSVRDPLDIGVEFVSASYGGVTLTADRTSTQGDARTADGRTVHISMWQGPGTGDLEGRTVVYWDLGEHPTEFKDSVMLTVRVTEKATEKADLTVYNQAFVKVNGDPEQATEIPENPVPTPDGGPHKIETDPGDGENTIVGQVITYRITWENYDDVPATVKIRDPLDANVDFVSASDGGVYTNEDHTVRWDLGEQPAGATGSVDLRVVVTERAKEPGIVYNQAYVQIGNHPEQETEIPENPVPDGEPHKTEVDPGDKKPVDVRQIIMYRIDWWNYKGVPATITIRDPLDEGLTFFGATDGGVYDSATRTVTWHLGEKAAGDSGSVFLRCIVNPRARDKGIVKNQAYVQVGNDPEQETEIPENPVPTPTPRPNRPTRKPDTGDNNDPGLWLAVLAAMSFGAGATGVVIHRRRRKNK